MVDMFWSCPHCGKHLAIDEQGVGREVSCTACNRDVVIPEVATHWLCSECHTKLGAASSLVGDHVHCSNCGKEQTVPRAGKSSKTVKIDLSTYGTTTKEEDVPPETTGTCPECGSSVPADARICVKCGLNLKSGAHLHKVTSLVARPAPLKPPRDVARIVKISALIAVILLALGSVARFSVQKTPRRAYAHPDIGTRYQAFLDLYYFYLALSDGLNKGMGFPEFERIYDYLAAEHRSITADPSLKNDAGLPRLLAPLSSLEALLIVWNAIESGGAVQGQDAATILKAHPEFRAAAIGSQKSMNLNADELFPQLMEICRRQLSEVLQLMAED